MARHSDAARVNEAGPPNPLNGAPRRAAARRFFETQYTPYRIEEPQPGLVTGYYEPELNGSRERTDKFQDGDMLAIYLKNQRRTTLRHVHRENGHLRVHSANPDTQPQYYKPTELEIRGTVLAILRKRDM